MGSRPDIYTKVHKGLRKALFDLSNATGNTDYHNDESIISLAKQFNEVIKFLEEHGRNEELYQLPLLESKFPGAAKHDNSEHELIEKKLIILKRSFNNLIAAVNHERKLKGEVFYHLLSEFISDYLNHMREEEIETANLFYEHCTDEEITSSFKKIVANTSPQDMMMMLKYMIPAVNHPERVELFIGLKQNAPQPAFNAVLILAQSLLTIQEWENLKREIFAVKTKSNSDVWEAVA